MKNTKLMTLGLILTGATLALAQDVVGTHKQPSTPGARSRMIERDLHGLTAEQNAELAATTYRLAEAAKAQEGAQQKLILAQAGGGGTGGRSHGAILGTIARQRTSRSLVIPKDASNAQNLGEVEEDLAVMAHILHKTVSSGDKTAQAMGIAVFGKLPGAVSTPQNFYIDGTGAIFLLSVNYPLQPPLKKEAAEAKEPSNSEWEEARREVAHPNQFQIGTDPMMLWENFGAEGARNAGEYDAEKVEELKNNLISAMKNAANIRRLKSDETITVVVTGSEAGVITKRSVNAGSKPGFGGSSRSVVLATTGQSGEGARTSDAAKLILRARKADAEAFQNGKLDFDDFRKKVTTMIY